MNERKLVLPGDILGEGRSGNNAFMEGNKVFSKSVGLAEEKGGVFFVIPLSGIYNPKRGDGVIGKVEEIIVEKGLAKNKILIVNNKEKINTLKDYAFVIPENMFKK